MSIVCPGIATMETSCSIKDSHNSINFIFSEQSSFHRRWAMIPFKLVLAHVVVVLQVQFNREVEAIVRLNVCREASWFCWIYFRIKPLLWPTIEQYSPAQNHHKVLRADPSRNFISCLQYGSDAPTKQVCPEAWFQSIEVDCNERETPTLVNRPVNRKALQFESMIFFSLKHGRCFHTNEGTKFGSNPCVTRTLCHAA